MCVVSFFTYSFFYVCFILKKKVLFSLHKHDFVREQIISGIQIWLNINILLRRAKSYSNNFIKNIWGSNINDHLTYRGCRFNIWVTLWTIVTSFMNDPLSVGIISSSHFHTIKNCQKNKQLSNLCKMMRNLRSSH